jgi:hypothetical protein
MRKSRCTPSPFPKSQISKASKLWWNSSARIISKNFKTLGLGQLGGRLLSETEVDSARHVAVINEALSDRLFAHENPVRAKDQTKGLR